MHVKRLPAAVVVLLGAAAPGARAQIDYRNLDDDRPTAVEDAYPVERYAFELLLPYRFERHAAGGTVHASVLELEYGVIRNGQLGIKAPLAVVREAGITESGLSGLRVFGLYNFNAEAVWLPALALRADLSLPVGPLAASDAQVSAKAIATRSFGRNRVHLNVAHTFGPDAVPAVAEGAHRWFVGAALDRTLFRQSMLVLGEVYARQPGRGAPAEVNGSVGLRYQWTPTAVLDLGVARRLRGDVGPDLAVTFGMSYVFAVKALMPGGGR